MKFKGNKYDALQPDFLNLHKYKKKRNISIAINTKKGLVF